MEVSVSVTASTPRYALPRPRRRANCSAHSLMPPLRLIKSPSGSSKSLYSAAYRSTRDHLLRVRHRPCLDRPCKKSQRRTVPAPFRDNLIAELTNLDCSLYSVLQLNVLSRSVGERPLLKTSSPSSSNPIVGSVGYPKSEICFHASSRVIFKAWIACSTFDDDLLGAKPS